VTSPAALLVDNSARPPKKRRPRVAAEGERPTILARIVTIGVLGFAVVYFLVPVYWLVVASTKSTTELYNSAGFLFTEFQFWDNLVAVSTYNDGIFWRWMLNSGLYSGVGSLLMAAISVITGYALAIYQFRGKSVVVAIVLGSMLIPQTVLAQPLYLLVVALGLNNTYLGVLLPSIVYPFGVLLAYVFAQQSIPKEIIEASRLDGAGEFRTFFSVGLRLMIPGSVTILLFAFIGSWNSYLLPLLILNDAELMPITVGLSGWSQASITIPQLQSLTVIGSLISIIPIVIIFSSLQRYWKTGLSVGGARF
jgi:multiple sugar transport system permease protein